MPQAMTGPINQAVAKITGGLYTIAIFAVVLAVIAILVGKKHGGKDRRKGKLTADLIWAVGLLLFAVLVLPRLFSPG